MKKLITLIVAVPLIVAVLMIPSMLTACGENPVDNPATDDEAPVKESFFVTVYTDSYYYIVYCKDTRVMYSISDGAYNRGTPTLLVNPDGSPMIYHGDE